LSEIIFKVTEESKDTGIDIEIVSEGKVDGVVNGIMESTRNVNGFKLTVERIQ